MKKSLLILSATGLMLWTASCGGGGTPTPSLKELDLKEQGLPIKIKAPQDAQATAKPEVLGMQEVQVKGQDFHITIYGTDATQVDRKAIKTETLQDEQNSSTCKVTRMISDEDYAFVYERVCAPDTMKLVDFRYFLLRGDRLYTFQTSNSTTLFNEQQVKAMLDAVRQEPAPAEVKK